MHSATRTAAPFLLLLVLCSGSSYLAAAQWMEPLPPLPGMPPMQPMQPLPPLATIQEGGMSASAVAVSNGPGRADAVAVNNNGATVRHTSASGNAVASATTSGPSGTCQVISQSNSGACSNGTPCCRVAQKVERCRGYATAVAKVNGVTGHCCITLLKTPNNTPQLFCAAPAAGKNYLQMPANAKIELKPSCKSNRNNIGSIACTVTFPNGLPRGYTYPAGFNSKAPLSLYADKPFPGFKPCNAGGKFKRFIQAVSSTRPVSLTSKCE